MVHTSRRKSRSELDDLMIKKRLQEKRIQQLKKEIEHDPPKNEVSKKSQSNFYGMAQTCPEESNEKRSRSRSPRRPTRKKPPSRDGRMPNARTNDARMGGRDLRRTRIGPGRFGPLKSSGELPPQNKIVPLLQLDIRDVPKVLDIRDVPQDYEMEVDTPRRIPKIVKKHKAANKRMFGMLMGHLTRGRKELSRDLKSSRMHARTVVEKRISQKLESRASIAQNRRAEREQRRKRRRLKEEAHELRVIEWRIDQTDKQKLMDVCEKRAESLSHFLITKAMPRIHYLPKLHNEKTTELLAESRAHHHGIAQKEIESIRESFQPEPVLSEEEKDSEDERERALWDRARERANLKRKREHLDAEEERERKRKFYDAERVRRAKIANEKLSEKESADAKVKNGEETRKRSRVSSERSNGGRSHRDDDRSKRSRRSSSDRQSDAVDKDVVDKDAVGKDAVGKDFEDADHEETEETPIPTSGDRPPPPPPTEKGESEEISKESAEGTAEETTESVSKETAETEAISQINEESTPTESTPEDRGD
eukprot:872673_1